MGRRGQPSRAIVLCVRLYRPGRFIFTYLHRLLLWILKKKVRFRYLGNVSFWLVTTFVRVVLKEEIVVLCLSLVFFLCFYFPFVSIKSC